MRTDIGERVLYPGIEVRLMRGNNALALLPPFEQIAPPAASVAGGLPATDPIYAAYPHYRTAESVFKNGGGGSSATSKAAEGQEPVEGSYFRKPDYCHMLTPQPSIAYNKNNRIAWQTTVVYPVGDLRGKNIADMRGLLIIADQANYRFQIKSTIPARLRLNGKTTEVMTDYKKDAKGKIISELFTSEILELELKEGLVDFGITLDNKESVIPELCLMWQLPNATNFTAIHGGRFLHAVTPEVDAAYSKFQKGCPWREGMQILPKAIDPTDQTDPSNQFAAYVDTLDIAAAVTNNKAFVDASKTLHEGWLHDSKLAGSAQVARSLMELTRARIQILRNDSSQLGIGGWSQCHGSYLQHTEWLRGFLEMCMRSPELQSEALATRADLHCYTAIIHNRSFLSEKHYATNDGYYDQNNFLVNIWRGANAWDDPLAYDMARSLYDSHFSYGYGSKGCMHSDGIFSFHTANGRHLNMEGYGKDWMNRVCNGHNFGSPWGNLQEQYHRLAEFSLALEWFFYKGAKAFTTAGRHNTHRGSPTTKYTDRLLALPKTALDSETRKSMEDQKIRISQKKPLQGNRFFFRHLQMIHRRADYDIDVKMSSPLVGGIETFASAQPGNLSFGDGVTTILRHGDEYRDIHAYNIPESLWRFRSLPGTTQMDFEYGNLDKWGGLDRYRSGGGSTAGGVSDGEFGHCAFDFRSHGHNATQAKKFFAFMEDGMMVLGAGITGSKKARLYPRYTYRSNINQCGFKSDVKITDSTGLTVTIKAGDLEQTKSFALNQNYWVEHNGIGYLVMPTNSEQGSETPGYLVIQTSMRNPLNRMKDDIWAKTNMKDYMEKCKALVEKENPRQTPVLEIWIDHCEQPKNATCAYFVCMHPEKKSPAEWLAKPPVSILANTSLLHAVADMNHNIIHAFFREPGKLQLKNGKTLLEVDKPAAIMVRMKKNQPPQITVQDPRAACTRTLKDMSDITNVTWHGKSGEKKTTFRMPGTGDPDDRYRGGMVTQPAGSD